MAACAHHLPSWLVCGTLVVLSGVVVCLAVIVYGLVKTS